MSRCFVSLPLRGQHYLSWTRLVRKVPIEREAPIGGVAAIRMELPDQAWGRQNCMHEVLASAIKSCSLLSYAEASEGK